MIADVASPYQEEALPQGVDTGSLAFSYFSHLYFFFLLTLSIFAGADISAKDLGPIVTKAVMELSPNILVVEAQAGIPHAVQRVESFPVPGSGDTAIEETPEMAILDPGSGLSTFLARFDSLEFYSLLASHFLRFAPLLWQLPTLLSAC